jgi:hypothetical protein
MSKMSKKIDKGEKMSKKINIGEIKTIDRLYRLEDIRTYKRTQLLMKKCDRICKNMSTFDLTILKVL